MPHITVPVKEEADLETAEATSFIPSSFRQLGNHVKQFFKGTIALLGFAAVGGAAYLVLGGFRSRGNAQNHQAAFSAHSDSTIEEVETNENLFPQNALTLNQDTHSHLIDTNQNLHLTEYTYSPVVELSNMISQGEGIKFEGEEAGDRSGYSVSGAGDINGDGLDDLVIGAYGASHHSLNPGSGSSYVIFGRNTTWDCIVNLSSLNGANGFKINGEATDDLSGYSVSGAGDINGDGMSDLVIGAFYADPSGLGYAGSSYVIFGRNTPWNPTVELSSLNGINGFKINGEAAGDLSGHVVSGAGDINGDGFDDLVIGASGADPSGKTSAGSSYVIFGRNTPWNPTVELSSLNGINGFKINGEAAGDFSGYSVSRAGDINGDRLDDLVVGAFYADPSGRDQAGSSYVIFGRNTTWSPTVELSSLNGINGFKINGEAAGDFSGHAVSRTGDVNGDGLDDLVIGAYGADPSDRDQAGSSYVIFGRNALWNLTVELSSLNGVNGFKINGEATGDFSGYAVGGAGDINGDGLDDLVIGAYGADPSGRNHAGSCYVIFGQNTTWNPTVELSSLNGVNGFKINGEKANDYCCQSVSEAGDINGDGLGDLVIGAHGASPSGRSYAGSTYLILSRVGKVDPLCFNSSFSSSTGPHILPTSSSSTGAGAPSNSSNYSSSLILPIVLGIAGGCVVAAVGVYFSYKNCETHKQNKEEEKSRGQITEVELQNAPHEEKERQQQKVLPRQQKELERLPEEVTQNEQAEGKTENQVPLKEMKLVERYECSYEKDKIEKSYKEKEEEIALLKTKLQEKQRELELERIKAQIREVELQTKLQTNSFQPAIQINAVEGQPSNTASAQPPPYDLEGSEKEPQPKLVLAEQKELHADTIRQSSQIEGQEQADTAASAPPIDGLKESKEEKEVKDSKISNSNEIDGNELQWGDKLGRGTYGVVYKGSYRQTDIAIKKLLTSVLTEASLGDFKNEMQHMKQLQSQYLVKFYGYCVKPNYCIVMEYVQQGSLFKVLHSSQLLDWVLCYRLMTEIACGLAFLHSENIMHQDMRSSNVLLDENNHAKLADFGLSRIKTEVRNLASVPSIEPIAWKAPELFKPGSQCTKSADIYSMGITFWEIASRKLPFAESEGKAEVTQKWVSEGKRDAIPHDCPAKLTTLIQFCWNDQPEKRPAAEQVVRYLRQDRENDFKIFAEYETKEATESQHLSQSRSSMS